MHRKNLTPWTVAGITALTVILAATLGMNAPTMDNSVQPQMSYHFIRVDGLSIFYREAGPKDAPTILLLHGLPSSSRMFQPLLTRLADNYHLVAPDYPGFGHSDWPIPKQFDYTFDNIANVMNAFTETLGISQYTLYMQDYGGPVGFRMILEHPERVQALIVQDAVAHNEGLGANWATRRAFWADRPAYEEALRKNLLSLATTKTRHVATTRTLSSTTPTSGPVSTHSSTHQTRRRFKVISSTITAPMSRPIQNGRHGCKELSQNYWSFGASTISPSILANPNAIARMYPVPRSTYSTLVTSRSTPSQTRSQHWLANS
jgi:pimeloyl-ACP methyl ester carboxylesterase